jgi:hypothetical protein
VFRIYTQDHDEIPRLLTVPQMSGSWRRWATDVVAQTRGRQAEVGDPGCCR